MNFNFSFKTNISPKEPACWFVFRKEKILTWTDGTATKPLLIRAADLPGINCEKAVHVGILDGIDCYAVEDMTVNGIEITGAEWVPLRQPYGKFDDQMFHIYGRARQLLTWAENSRFCGRCGNSMALKSDERCFVCSSCGFISFPPDIAGGHCVD